ncbi:MAG: sodium/solute symporter [Bacteroidota bacterium]
MNTLDYIIIAIYSIGLLGLGYFFKDQKDTKDYFLGGRSFGWFSMGMSTMASQLSAISFISAAAFVGLKPNGGMQWLTYEFAVPLAMIFLIVVIIPPLYNAGVVSIYSYLEERFSSTTRVLISCVFQISRAFATGIMIYVVALVLAGVMDIPFEYTVLVSGIVTIIYAYQGGMKAVVWGDVIQMIILLLGLIICTVYGLIQVGGLSGLSANVDVTRTNVLDFNWGIGEGQEFGFWPMIIGGFFLYASYYGCDQSQAQRSLSGKSLKEVQRALLFNGLFRFPVVICYCFMGLVIGTFAMTEAGSGLMTEILNISQASFAEVDGLQPGEIKPDLLIPVFIMQYLPHGIIGLLLVAILAAAMSSLSSAINSLSAATVEDLINRNRKTPLTTERHLRISKMMTVVWGLFCMILAFSAGNIADTVIEAINKVGSAFYGPIVATFILAILSKRVTAVGMNIGLLVGVGVNVYIWLSGAPIFWMWWNFIGAAVTLSIAYLSSALIGNRNVNALLTIPKLNFFRTESYILLGYFFFMVFVSWCLSMG